MSDKASVLTAKEVCSIIKASKDAGLFSLEFGELKFRFWGEVQPIPHPIHVPRTTLERQSAVERDAIESDELSLREDALEELLIKDPTAFEKHMVSDDVDAGQRGSEIADSEYDRYRGAE